MADDLKAVDFRQWDDTGTRLEVVWDSGAAYVSIVRYGDPEDEERVIRLTDKQLRELTQEIVSELPKSKAARSR